MADSNTPTNAEINGMSETALEDLAHSRSIIVTGAGGGTATRADYLNALLSKDQAKEVQNIASAKAAKLDEAPKGGRYINAQGQWVNSHGQQIDKDTGEPLDGSAPKSGEQVRY